MAGPNARLLPFWVLLAVAAIGLLIARLEALTTALLLAWFVAYALDPVLDRLEARRVPRAAGILVLLAGVFLGVALLGLLVVPSLAAQLRSAGRALPEYAATLQHHLVPRLEAWLGRPLPTETSALLADAAGAVRDAVPGLPATVAKGVARVFVNAWSLAGSLLGLTLIPVFAFYLLLDFNGLGARLADLTPYRVRPAAHRVLERCDQVLGAFVRGQLTVCAALAVIYAVGLSFTGIDMPWVVGLVSGALFIVPYLGTLVGVVLGSALALLKFHDLWHLLAVWAVFAGGQAIEGFLLTPRIVGNRVGLHPLAVLVAVLAGGELFGFVGVLLAVPGAAVLRVAAGEALDRYRKSAAYRGGVP